LEMSAAVAPRSSMIIPATIPMTAEPNTARTAQDASSTDSAVIGIVAGMIMLDLGATAADISNRTVIFSLRPDVRTRLATIYMIGKFSGAGVAAWLTGLAWSTDGWPGVCGLGGALAAMAGVTALLRVRMTSDAV
jgi:hypothetical protein